MSKGGKGGSTTQTQPYNPTGTFAQLPFDPTYMDDFIPVTNPNTGTAGQALSSLGYGMGQQPFASYQSPTQQAMQQASTYGNSNMVYGGGSISPNADIPSGQGGTWTSSSSNYPGYKPGPLSPVTGTAPINPATNQPYTPMNAAGTAAMPGYWTKDQGTFIPQYSGPSLYGAPNEGREYYYYGNTPGQYFMDKTYGNMDPSMLNAWAKQYGYDDFGRMSYAMSFFPYESAPQYPFGPTVHQTLSQAAASNPNFAQMFGTPQDAQNYLNQYGNLSTADYALGGKPQNWEFGAPVSNAMNAMGYSDLPSFMQTLNMLGYNPQTGQLNPTGAWATSPYLPLMQQAAMSLTNQSAASNAALAAIPPPSWQEPRIRPPNQGMGDIPTGGGGGETPPAAESLASDPFRLQAYNQMMGNNFYGGVIPQLLRSTAPPGDVWGTLNSMGIQRG